MTSDIEKQRVRQILAEILKLDDAECKMQEESTKMIKLNFQGNIKQVPFPKGKSKEDADLFYNSVVNALNISKESMLKVTDADDLDKLLHLREAVERGIENYFYKGELEIFEKTSSVQVVISVDQKVLVGMVGMMSIHSESLIPDGVVNTAQRLSIRSNRDVFNQDPFRVLTRLNRENVKELLKNYYSRLQFVSEVENSNAGVQEARLLNLSGSWSVNSDDNFTDVCLPNYSKIEGAHEKAITNAPIRIFFTDENGQRFRGHQINSNSDISVKIQLHNNVAFANNAIETLKAEATVYQVLKGLDYYLNNCSSTLPYIHYLLLNKFLTTRRDAVLESKIKYPMENYTMYRNERIKPKGILFFGPPGTGKSFLCKEMCECLGMVVLNKNKSMDASRFSGALSGDASKKIFNETLKAKVTPYLLHCMILDELESVGAKRKSEKTEGHKVDTLNTLLTKISDTFEQFDNTFYLACTNAKDSIEEALTRAGRIESHIFIGPLSFEQKRAVIMKYFDTKLTLKFREIYPTQEKQIELLSKLEPVIHKLTLNFTFAQLSSILFKFSHLILRGEQSKGFDEILESVILKELEWSTEKRLRYNKLLEKHEYNKYCKIYEDDYRQKIIKKFNSITTAYTSAVGTGNFIIYQSRNTKNFLSSFISHEMAGKSDEISLPPCSNLRQLVYFATNPIAAKMDIQTVHIVDSYSMEDVEKEIHGHLKEIQQETEHQAGTMVIFFLDELVGFTASWKQSQNTIISANNSIQKLQQQNTTDSKSNNTTNSSATSYDVSITLDESTSKSIASEIGHNVSNSSSVSKETSISDSYSDGDWTHQNSKSTTNNNTVTHEQFTSKSEVDENQIAFSRALGVAQNFDKSFQRTNTIDKSNMKSATNTTEASISKDFTDTIEYEMTHPKVLHTIMSFIINSRNLDIKNEKKKPYIVLVTQHDQMYKLLVNQLRWGCNSLYESVNALNLSDKNCRKENGVENYEFLIKCTSLQLIKLEYSVSGIGQRGIGYLDRFWNANQYKHIRSQLKRIEIQLGHVDDTGDASIKNVISELLSKCENLEQISLYYSSPDTRSKIEQIALQNHRKTTDDSKAIITKK